MALIVQPMMLSAQTNNPAWMDDLNFQMEAELECEVAYYIRIREGELGGKQFQEARLQCVDGRQFDAERIEPEDKFDVRPCEIQVC